MSQGSEWKSKFLMPRANRWQFLDLSSGRSDVKAHILPAISLCLLINKQIIRIVKYPLTYFGQLSPGIDIQKNQETIIRLSVEMQYQDKTPAWEVISGRVEPSDHHWLTDSIILTRYLICLSIYFPSENKLLFKQTS